ncbi:hypothetical protein F511_17413 [Dorcoceras hygrometricum]|uniref:Uncharacterized protein n=1 Tax=Dorcoceras hygrometricum TaxID=472368 RepID=A0A2Z7C8J1_9LAMI|nr:hypothetical protein F511_17413 [Dorcoceras hygrometricum]
MEDNAWRRVRHQLPRRHRLASLHPRACLPRHEQRWGMGLDAPRRYSRYHRSSNSEDFKLLLPEIPCVLCLDLQALKLRAKAPDFAISSDPCVCQLSLQHLILSLECPLLLVPACSQLLELTQHLCLGSRTSSNVRQVEATSR